MLTEVHNWSRFPSSHSVLIPVDSLEQQIPFDKFDGSFLPYGMGRSLGDCCLNDGNALLMTRGLKRILGFDVANGRLTVEAGCSFDEILKVIVPQGWFLPVTPGTRFVSVGGAIANDVHGKNHHWVGTFGRHITRLCLRRSDGQRLICSEGENGDWFRATVAGLGLTGLIEWAELQLKPIMNSLIDAETIRYGDLAEFYALSEESSTGYEYVVAWLDTGHRDLGRGLFIRGNHNQDPERKTRQAPTGPFVTVPFVTPISVLNRYTLKIFNSLFYYCRGDSHSEVTPLATFFYPLDSIGAYHRIYGRQGMVQWQGLVPSREAVREILSFVPQIGGSFLTVMKVMGDHRRSGLLSFSGSGVTISLDFPYSQSVIDKLPRLDQIVLEAAGRLYPAKDARMSARYFQGYYPQWEEVLPFIDRRFSSSFWRRVTARSLS